MSDTYVPQAQPPMHPDTRVSRILAQDLANQALLIARFQAQAEEMSEIIGGLDLSNFKEVRDEDEEVVAIEVPVQAMQTINVLMSRVHGLTV